MGPTLPASEEIHRTKYRNEGESFREAMNRVANTLKDNASHFYYFREALLDMRFLPGGRVQAAVGSTKGTTPYNCYVSGTIADNFTGDDGIMDRAGEAAATMRMGGGIGYDFSTLRPRGDLIRTLQSRASGPVSFMAIFDAVCRTIASAGHRRGAQMGVLRVDHPDIEEFILAKQSQSRAPLLWALAEELAHKDDSRAPSVIRELQQTNALTGFNISIAVTDEFMEAVVADKPFDLKWNDRVYRTIDARALWEQIMRSTWDWAEPGVLFIDQINRMNNLWYCEKIAASNPCGEQPLPPYGACLLGSFNLTRYIRRNTDYQEILNEGDYEFDWDQLIEDIPHVVRAMDNVVDVAKYPLAHQEIEAKDKRRMGLGITGLANAGEALGYTYGSPAFLQFEYEVLATIARECYKASALLASEKGSFRAFDKERYLQSKFLASMPEDVREYIERYGMRNSHLTSIAPTGTISLAANNVSSGIEPVFAYSVDRAVNDFNGVRIERLEDYGVRVFDVKGKLAEECSADDHLGVLTTAYKNVDSAVSKTCNVSPLMGWEDFKNIYIRAWESGCKGCTTFNSGGRRLGVLTAVKDPPQEESPQACYIDANGRRECE